MTPCPTLLLRGLNHYISRKQKQVNDHLFISINTYKGLHHSVTHILSIFRMWRENVEQIPPSASHVVECTLSNTNKKMGHMLGISAGALSEKIKLNTLPVHHMYRRQNVIYKKCKLCRLQLTRQMIKPSAPKHKEPTQQHFVKVMYTAHRLRQLSHSQVKDLKPRC